MINWSVIVVTLFFVIFDYVTGVIQAVCNKDVQSSRMREGLFHKGAFVLVIILAIACEVAMGAIPEIGFTLPLVVPVCSYLIVTELVSIMENLGLMNSDLMSSKILSIFKISKED